MHQIVVIGDVHHHLWVAVEALERIEATTGRAISQAFSVGDMGLFLDEDDWRYLTGPSKYRRPEDSKRIREAWERWRWPLSAIAGNHEPFHRLRDWDAAFFSFKMEYTNAGELAHRIPGLRVAGLSGIFHPNEMDFLSPLQHSHGKLPQAESWPEMVAFAESNKISRSRLTYWRDLAKSSQLMRQSVPEKGPDNNERQEIRDRGQDPDIEAALPRSTPFSR